MMIFHFKMKIMNLVKNLIILVFNFLIALKIYKMFMKLCQHVIL